MILILFQVEFLRPVSKEMRRVTIPRHRVILNHSLHPKLSHRMERFQSYCQWKWLIELCYILTSISIPKHQHQAATLQRLNNDLLFLVFLYFSTYVHQVYFTFFHCFTKCSCTLDFIEVIRYFQLFLNFTFHQGDQILSDVPELHILSGYVTRYFQRKRRFVSLYHLT